MRILLTGCKGQVGSELARILEEATAIDREALDLADAPALRRFVQDLKPQIIVNAAAHTAVDRAESEPELARQVNGVAPRVLAEEAQRLGALMVHYSTDYIFDGSKSTPYIEDDPPRPLGVYGATKLEGERAVRESGARHLILRTAWVYGRGRNFVAAILRQAEKGAPLRVVNDQFGAPTWAADIAAMTAALLERQASGTFHVTAAGKASWYEVAGEILRLAKLDVPLQAVSSAAYPTKAQRPRYSVLDNGRLARAGVKPIGDWRERLAEHFRRDAGSK